MLYHCHNPILQVLTVGDVTWEKRSLTVAPRPFSALALRLEGDGTIFWGQEERLSLAPGQVLYLPQGLPYKAQYGKTHILVVHFLTQNQDTAPELYTLQNPMEAQSLLSQMYTLWQRKTPGYLARCMSLFYRLLALLGENEATRLLPRNFLKACAALTENYTSSQLQIEALCRESGISQTVFRQLFRQHYGKSPVAYLTQLRLEHARALLTQGESVETAALKSGFTDPKYFARVVKAQMGCTPRQLRSP